MAILGYYIVNTEVEMTEQAKTMIIGGRQG
jgi:hypothetical protein